MAGQTRRNAIRKYGRSQATGFFLGMLCLMAFFVFASVVRPSAEAKFGETAWLWFFVIAMFASFLIPPMIVQRYVVKDPLLYCPHCNNFLGLIRAAAKLNKHAICNHCCSKIEIAPSTKKCALYDVSYILGGLLTIICMSLLTLEIVKRIIPLVG